MTDPDDRRSRSRSATPPVASQAIPQPNFLAADLDEPRLHPMPILPRLNLQPPMIGVPAIPANSISLNDPEDDPFGFHDGPRHNLAPQRLAEEYGVYIPPEVQLPANWDAPLQNPMPVVPPMPIPPRRRGRGGRAVLGPLHNISGRQNDPALNGLHRGHIAHREQAANYRAEVQNLIEQRRQQQEYLAEQMRIGRERLADLQQQQQDEEQQRREAEAARNMAWARERQQEAQAAYEEEECQNIEAYQRKVNHMHHQEELEAHTSRGLGRGRDQENPEAAAAAADYEINRHHENQLRREEEAEQQRQQEMNQRIHNAANNNIPRQILPRGRRPYHEPQGGPEHHYLGPMNVECNHCHALHFESEKLSSST